MEFRSSGFVINDFPDKNCGDFGGNSWSFGSFDLESEKSHHRGMVKETENDDDIIGRLPADPFGMDVRSTGWIQIYERDSGKECYGLKINEVESKIGDHRLFAGLSNVKYEEISVPCDGFNGIVVDNGLRDSGLVSMRLKLDSNVKFDERSIPYDKSCGFVVDSGLCDVGLVSMGLKLDANDVKIDERSITYDRSSGFVVDSRLCDIGFVSELNVEDWIVCDPAEGMQDCGGVYLDGGREGGEPHDAIFFALCYLDVQDLLMVERVCKSLRDAVRSDNLIWSSIHIYYPLNVRLTDDALVQITSRAQGTLRCLSLVECINITDNGLKLVLENNPRMTNLSVPGCVRLSVQGILFYLRASNSAGKTGIKHLQIGGLLNISDKQFEELKFLLGADNRLQMKARKPQFFCGRHFCLTCDDDRPIDIDMCPMCQKLGLVYDCPTESCQKKHPAAQLCRACTLCIERCVHCGCCINGGVYEETFSLDCLCWDCWKKCEDWTEVKDASSSKSTNYQFFRNG